MAQDGAPAAQSQPTADLRNFAPKRAAERHYQALYEAFKPGSNAQLSKATPHQVLPADSRSRPLARCTSLHTAHTSSVVSLTCLSSYSAGQRASSSHQPSRNREHDLRNVCTLTGRHTPSRATTIPEVLRGNSL